MPTIAITTSNSTSVNPPPKPVAFCRSSWQFHPLTPLADAVVGRSTKSTSSPLRRFGRRRFPTSTIVESPPAHPAAHRHASPAERGNRLEAALAVGPLAQLDDAPVARRCQAHGRQGPITPSQVLPSPDRARSGATTWCASRWETNSILLRRPNSVTAAGTLPATHNPGSPSMKSASMCARQRAARSASGTSASGSRLIDAEPFLLVQGTRGSSKSWYAEA